MKKWLKRAGILLASILVLGSVAFYVYTLDFYRADDLAVKQYANQGIIQGRIHSFLNENSSIGLIVYPGGKVEAKAYAVLANRMQEIGINTFIADMPFNLAVFDINAASRIRELYPNIQEWYIIGHSLGGAMASAHVGSNADHYQGIIYLAAYPINEATLPRLIIYGDKDGVLNLERLTPFLDEAKIIRGGNHAQFANYGEQAGDLKASINTTQQQDITINLIVSFIKDTCTSCKFE
jgi:hypothetical protein